MRGSYSFLVIDRIRLPINANVFFEADNSKGREPLKARAPSMLICV